MKSKWIKMSIISLIFIFLLIGIIFIDRNYLLTSQNSSSNKNITKNIEFYNNGEIYYVDKDEDTYIFTAKYQNTISQKIQDLLKDNEYNMENPLIINNPYGTNTLSLNIYFEEERKIDVKYTISAEGTKDFSKSLKYNDNNGYQIIGLVPGKTNNVLINYYEDGNEVGRKEFNIIVPELEHGIDAEFTFEDGESNEEITDGLFALLGHDKSFSSNIYLYDNDGIIRSELVLDDYRGDRIIFKDDKMIYSNSTNSIIAVNNLGKIESFYSLGNYEMHHDYVYDEVNNKLLILANKLGSETIEDVVISLDLATGDAKEVLDMRDLLGDMYEKAVMPKSGKNTYGGDELDWIHLNSLQVIDGKDIIVSARELSTIIRVNNIYNDPELKYLIADESVYKDTEYEEYLYNKIGDFTANAGQHTITYLKDDTLEEGKYYVYMFNNNYKGASTRPDFDWSNYVGCGTYSEGDKSMYYKYLVDENEGTYELVDSFDVDYSSIVSSVEILQDNYIVSSGMSHSYAEYDSEKNLIRKYKYNSKKYAYRVFKYIFDNFWFE